MKKINKEQNCEDCCFYCKEGGSLRICDFKNCLKCYHPSCVNKDDTFLDDEVPWSCGWHFCFICYKASKFQCFSCPLAVCGRGPCTASAEFIVIKGKKGLCRVCLDLALLIEKNVDVDSNGNKVDFKDKGTCEYLFKVYWDTLKRKEGLTSEKILSAEVVYEKGPDSRFSTEQHEIDENEEDGALLSDYESADEDEELIRSQKRRRRTGQSLGSTYNVKSKTHEFIGWGSRVLIEFLQSLGKDVTKPLSQYDVESIIIEYIQKNKLLHPKRKRVVLCDAKLQPVFRKKSVIKNRIYRLLETHLAQNREQSNEDVHGLDGCSSEEYGDKMLTPCRRDGKLKEDRTHQINPGITHQRNKEAGHIQKTGLASIIPENIRLVYLERSLVEDLQKTPETFEAKLEGSVVRIRKDPYDCMQTNSHQLVLVTGIKKDLCNKEVLLQVSNRTKDIPISNLSDEDFPMEECKDLQQRMTNGLLKKIHVAELQKKATSLHEDITKHRIAKELKLLANLIDKANEKGWRRDLFEYMQRKEVLEKSSEQSRQLQELPEVIAEIITLKPDSENLERIEHQGSQLSSKPQSPRNDEVSSEKFGVDCSFKDSASETNIYSEDASRRMLLRSQDNLNGNREHIKNEANNMEEDLTSGRIISTSHENGNGEASNANDANENKEDMGFKKAAPLYEAESSRSVDGEVQANKSVTIKAEGEAVFVNSDQIISNGSSSRTNCTFLNEPSVTVEEMVPSLETLSRLREVLKEFLELDLSSIILSDKKQKFLDCLSNLAHNAETPSELASPVKVLLPNFFAYPSRYQYAEDNISICKSLSAKHTTLVEELKMIQAAYEMKSVEEKEADSRILETEGTILQLQKKLADVKQEKTEILVHKQELAARKETKKDQLLKSSKELATWESRKKQAVYDRAQALSEWESFRNGGMRQARKESSDEELSRLHNDLDCERSTVGGSAVEASLQVGSKVSNKHGRPRNVEDTQVESKVKLVDIIELSDDDGEELETMDPEQASQRCFQSQ